VQEIKKLRDIYDALIADSGDAFWFAEIKTPLPLDVSEEEILERLWKDVIITECNTSFAKMYGFNSSADFIGTPLLAFVARRDARNTGAILTFLRSHQKVLEVATHEVDRDNNPHWFSSKVWKFTEGGRLIAALGMQRDITDAKEEEAERLKLLQTLAPQQKRLLQLIGHGSTPKEIADTLKVSVKTVYSERDKLKRKLNLFHTDDLQLLAHRLGFLPRDLTQMRFALIANDDGMEVQLHE
jgi:PAS domain S-box-containing protein